MGNKELVGLALALAGGYFYGFANGVESTIGSVFSAITEVTADVFSIKSYGMEAGIGQELGEGIVIKLGEYIMDDIGGTIGIFKAIGIILILAGLIYTYMIKET